MIEGATIVKIRSMTNAEYKREYWDNEPNNPVYVLELDNGCQIFASRDYEGNGGGALFGHDSKTHKAFTIAVDRKLPKNLPNPPVDTSHLNNEEFGEFIRNN